ncbi:MAG: c-type cytochrome [Gammaproteobacteria bacterium]|nr:c-type cytochrome [Gammaproteobacteria bacterium]
MLPHSDMSDMTFTKRFTAMIAGLALLTILLFVLANGVGGKTASDDSNAATVAERTAPVGSVQMAAQQALDVLVPVAEAADGKTTYETTCSACHAAGVAGAPKLGDKALWDPRIAQGLAVLEEHAIKGFQGKTGFMPAKGGNASLPDDAVKAAVAYMVEQAK